MPPEEFPDIPTEELERLAAGYVLNDLSDEEAERWQALQTAPAAIEAQQEMQASLAQVYDPEAIAPAPRLRDAILDAAWRQGLVTDRLVTDAFVTDDCVTDDCVSDRPLAASVVPLAPRQRRLPVKAFGAIAAVAIAALTTSNVLLWQALQQQTLRSGDAASLVLSLQPADASDRSPTEFADAVVTFRADPDRLRATLDLRDLPPLEPGKVYVLWTVLAPDAPFTKDAKSAILTQVFAIGSASDPDRLAFPLPPVFQQPDAVRAIAVTIEDADAPQDHNAAPILIQQL
ncbi:MAG: hypothetical protein HC795_14370 [Coleofasciculaceae cyanobacterium RL_1_1]|nr:hypothetical protein [Coleofasciculaceae cyanobacterium RL_1_1]